MPEVDNGADPFPFKGTLREQFLHALQYAVLAPSTHNTQPWLFQLDEDALLVFADRSRALPTVDPEGRELTMSVGAALDHLRLAMVCHLRQPEFGYLPDPTHPDLLARVTCVDEVVPTQDDLAAFNQVARRHTMRGHLSPAPVPVENLVALIRSVNDATAGVVLIEDEEFRERLAAMVHEGDQRLFGQPALRREVAGWLRPDYHRPDGVPSGTLGLNPVESVLAPWAMAHIDVAASAAARDRERVASAPAVAVVCTLGDERLDWIHAGRAVSRLTLNAAAQGLRCSYFLQPIHIAEFRAELKEATKAAGQPQIVVRLGYAEEGKPTPRRRVEDVLIERPPQGQGD